MKTHCSIIFEPVSWSFREELYWLFQKRRLDDDMLQQGELGVVRREKEGTSGVHLDSEVGWVKRMHLCIEGSIKISYREIEMFHLPRHSIALITKLNVNKVANGTTTGSKQINVLGFAVEVVDKQGDDSPFLVIECSKKGVDTGSYPC